jgi:uncharacterized membrane protein YkvI
MDERKARLQFMMLAFMALVVVGAILVLFAATVFWEEGSGSVFETSLGVPGILAILIGLIALLLLRLRHQ